MSAYSCALKLDGSRTGVATLLGLRTGLEASVNGPVTTVSDGPFTALVSAVGAMRPLIAQRPHMTGVGDVRLDNRREVERWTNRDCTGWSDLEVVLAALQTRGDSCVTELLGDFAFVVWDNRRHHLLAVRDAFGVKPLFRAERGGELMLSSRAAALAAGERYDREYIADFLVGGASHSARTIWDGVAAVPAATSISVLGRHVTATGYWSATNYLPAEGGDVGDQTERFRELFFTAVRERITDGAPVWAQLSGGLDSSSVVCAAEHLAAQDGVPSRIGATVTVVDTLSGGDERPFSDLVVRRHRLRNEALVDYWPWQDNGYEPPRVDEPNPFYPFFARDQRMCELVRAGGSRVLLSGTGSDHYLAGTLHYISDLVGRGRLMEAAGDIVAWSIALRCSFWGLARRYAVYPLLPTRLKLRYARPWQLAPGWLDSGFVRQMAISDRLPSLRKLQAPRGQLFAHAIANEIATLPAWVGRGPFETGMEMRYPFLSRPLVEFSLRLPPAMRTRPLRSKWVLREAMRGVLPESIRLRSGKGSIDARILWALNRESGRLGGLLRAPILADLGCIEPAELRLAVEAARCGRVKNLAFLLCTLSLETWMAVRAGQWGSVVASTATAA